MNEINLCELELPCRVNDILAKLGVRYASDLEGWSREQLLRVRGLGKISLREIEESLGRVGLSLAEDAAPVGDDPRERAWAARADLEDATANLKEAQARANDATERFHRAHAPIVRQLMHALRPHLRRACACVGLNGPRVEMTADGAEISSLDISIWPDGVSGQRFRVEAHKIKPDTIPLAIRRLAGAIEALGQKEDQP